MFGHSKKLFEDDSLIAFDKPSGLLVVADRWDKELANLMQLVREQVSPEIINVNVLDRETSGLVLCAKNADAGRKLVQQFELQQVVKTYIAIVRHGPSENNGRIDLPLAEDARKQGRMKVSRDGKPCETRYEVQERFPTGFNLVRLETNTGRAHQIRVHLAAISAPILCDPIYSDGTPLNLSDLKRNFKNKRGAESPILNRLALHASGLTIQHPLTGDSLTIESPLPHDMEHALKNLRRHQTARR